MSDLVAVVSPLQGVVVGVADAGTVVTAESVVALVESMKMHHEVRAGAPGVIAAVAVGPGTAVVVGSVLAEVDRAAAASAAAEAGADTGSADAEAGGSPERRSSAEPTATFDHRRDDLAELERRRRLGYDEQRPEAVAKRRARGRRTARENLADLLDPGSLVEYGSLAIAAQRRRRELAELMRATPADGLVGGLGTVNAAEFGASDARVVVASYDYTVLAGTQGTRNHAKKDRLFELAERLRLPVVLFTEGGGGRPGDTEAPGPTGLDCQAFALIAKLSGLVPLVAVNAGYCFAGNAALLGVCDVVIATVDSNIGMGGPAMIAGGGLGSVAPTAIGPIEVQRANGVVDLVAADEAEAVALAKRYLGYFQGPVSAFEVPDQRELRSLVPEDRRRAYPVRPVIEQLFDVGSVLELRRDFGVGMITALARLEGRPVAVLANDPFHLGGAIDADGADKAARFMQLCDAFDLPLVTLCDTPGFMVGPENEASAMVRHAGRMFVVGANLSIPTAAVVLRKCYGLGAQAMMGGSTKAPLACVAWPTGEFGGMGLEGFVELGFRRELDAAPDEAARQELYDRLVAERYAEGEAVSVAQYFEIDEVIDPAETRTVLTALLAGTPATRVGKKRPHVDTW